MKADVTRYYIDYVNRTIWESDHPLADTAIWSDTVLRAMKKGGVCSYYKWELFGSDWRRTDLLQYPARP